ncbi:MAG TPA: acyltransferase [Methylotenera sp.]
MQSKNISYIPAIDQIRGIAAIWILFFHAYQLIGSYVKNNKPFSGVSMWEFSNNPLLIPLIEGHTAVALFMVLSGFIFTYGSIGKTINYTGFITNRFLRIYPLYLTLIFVALASTPKAFNLPSFLSMVLPLADFQSLETGPLTAMAWAIGVEFQFYLLFPLLFKLAADKPFKTIVMWLLAVNLLRLLAVSLGGNTRDLTYWHLAGRIDQFLLGMLAAFWLKNHLPSKDLCRRLFLASIPISLLALIYYHSLGGWPSTGAWKALWPSVEGAIWAIFIAGFVGAQLKNKSWCGLPLQWIGVRSFSIYLLHFPIIQFLCKYPALLPKLTGEWRVDVLLISVFMVLPITIAISNITWNAIEKPFLNLRVAYIK